MIVVDAIDALHLQRDAAVGSRPTVYAHAQVRSFLQSTLAVAGATVFTTGWNQERDPLNVLTVD